VVASLTFGACSTGMKTWAGSILDEDTDSDSGVAGRPITDASVADCTDMQGTSAAPSAPAGEHTWVRDHGLVFAARRLMPEKPTGAYDTTEDRKVAAYVRLPQP
jgi:hypothetical protein